MSQDNLQTMIMQNFFFGGGLKEVYYGIVQAVNPSFVFDLHPNCSSHALKYDISDCIN